jgi:hypothetical protein
MNTHPFASSLIAMLEQTKKKHAEGSQVLIGPILELALMNGPVTWSIASLLRIVDRSDLRKF